MTSPLILLQEHLDLIYTEKRGDGAAGMNNMNENEADKSLNSSWDKLEGENVSRSIRVG